MIEYPTAREWFRIDHRLFDAVVMDIDGVLLDGGKSIPGAAEFIGLLIERGIPHRFLTNDACSPLGDKVERLKAGGIDVCAGDITSAGHGVEDVIRELGHIGALYLAMGKLGDPDYAVLAGLRVTRDIADLPKCSGVIIGESGYDWELTINAVVNRIVAAPDTRLVIPNPDWYFTVGNGEIHLASGAVGSLIRQALALHGEHIEPVLIGKPYPAIFRHNHAILEHENGPIARERVLMIGDSLTGDIAGGTGFGYRTALVLSGITRRRMVANASPPPDYLFASL